VPYEFWALIVGAYLLGSVPSAYLAGRWSRGIDIREYGSGNVGATNLLIATSRRTIAPVIIFDLFKGGIMVWLARWLGLGLDEQVLVGVVAVIGHNWSCFLRFNGGRGVITTMGVIFTLLTINSLASWRVLLLVLMIYGVIYLIGHFLKKGPLGVFIIFAVFPLFSWAFSLPQPFIIGVVGMFVILVVRRLTAPQPIRITSISKRQALVNRLLFDRDVRDKKAWMSLVLEQQEKQRNLKGNKTGNKK
jgi:glycerol-3-phosphate acyltransferase PlsY